MSQEATLEVGPEPQLRQPQLLELPPAVGVTYHQQVFLPQTHSSWGRRSIPLCLIQIPDPRIQEPSETVAECR